MFGSNIFTAFTQDQVKAKQLPVAYYDVSRVDVRQLSKMFLG